MIRPSVVKYVAKVLVVKNILPITSYGIQVSNEQCNVLLYVLSMYNVVPITFWCECNTQVNEFMDTMTRD